MEYLPLSLKLADTPVSLVGGGVIATRKARLLHRAGARLTVIAPSATDELQGLLADAGGIWHETSYEEAGLPDDCRLVVAATGVRPVDEAVYRDASLRDLLINVVDRPELCNVIFPSIVDRDPLTIAISSSGRSPVLARILRRKIEALVPAAYGRLARFAGRMRDRVKTALPEDTPRRLFWEQSLEGAIAEKVLAGREQEAEALLDERLADADALYRGEVYLLGAGPGDPDLLTFKAARLLQSADVVLYDRLVSPGIIELCRRDADRIYVGKRRADHAVPQQEINRLLLDLAREGKRVVRLKGGDPFVFGRGGEEIELLAEHGIPFQVVPGISAANGAACYAGIPLTHRDHAQSVRFVAGYLKGERVDHEWQSFQSANETLVFYMGLAGLDVICRELIAHGRDPSTPVALVERGTLSEQRVLTGTLETMPGVVAETRPSAPTLLIIGSVVRLHGSLAWFGEVAD